MNTDMNDDPWARSRACWCGSGRKLRHCHGDDQDGAPAGPAPEPPPSARPAAATRERIPPE